MRPTRGRLMSTNIVLLADGTGNSSSSPFKTNVWRLYQSIDIMSPEGELPRQIVYYDNGVGTENFKPIAALGGAFGIGVWQNVRALHLRLPQLQRRRSDLRLRLQPRRLHDPAADGADRQM